MMNDEIFKRGSTNFIANSKLDTLSRQHYVVKKLE